MSDKLIFRACGKCVNPHGKSITELFTEIDQDIEFQFSDIKQIHLYCSLFSSFIVYCVIMKQDNSIDEYMLNNHTEGEKIILQLDQNKDLAIRIIGDFNHLIIK